MIYFVSYEESWNQAKCTLEIPVLDIMGSAVNNKKNQCSFQRLIPCTLN